MGGGGGGEGSRENNVTRKMLQRGDRQAEHQSPDTHTHT